MSHAHSSFDLLPGERSLLGRTLANDDHVTRMIFCERVFDEAARDPLSHLPELESALSSPEPAIVWAAYTVLARLDRELPAVLRNSFHQLLGRRSFLICQHLLSKHPLVLCGVISFLGTMGQRASEYGRYVLHHMLHDDSNVRESAWLALARLGEPREHIVDCYLSLGRDVAEFDSAIRTDIDAALGELEKLVALRALFFGMAVLLPISRKVRNFYSEVFTRARSPMARRQACASLCSASWEIVEPFCGVLLPDGLQVSDSAAVVAAREALQILPAFGPRAAEALFRFSENLSKLPSSSIVNEIHSEARTAAARARGL